MKPHSVDADLYRPYQIWFEAMEAGDISAALSILTADVVRISPTGTTTLGRDATAAALAGFHAAYTETVRWSAEIRGRTAHSAELLIREVATISPRSGGAQFTVTGWHEGTLVRETDGVWRIARDVSFLDAG